MPELVQQLPDGPIDFIGDVHGELKRCNSCCPTWDTKQMAPILTGRRLVFLGDLVDRGPDSPAVALLVRSVGDQWQRQLHPRQP